MRWAWVRTYPMPRKLPAPINRRLKAVATSRHQKPRRSETLAGARTVGAESGWSSRCNIVRTDSNKTPAGDKPAESGRQGRRIKKRQKNGGRKMKKRDFHFSAPIFLPESPFRS